MTLYSYISKCVEWQARERQAANILSDQVRIAWMWKAWEYARGLAENGQRYPQLCDIIQIGHYIEPLLNRNDGFRLDPAWTPDHVGTDPEEIERELETLLRETPKILDPLEWYRRFEVIHPFKDGNGRAGKVLLNWIADSFDDPIIPPPNLFGKPVPNP